MCGALLIPAVQQIAAVVRVLSARATYTADVEWMEGGLLYQAYRLLHGLPIYGHSADAYVPYPYPPVHFSVVALVGAVVGLDFWSARAVSTLAFVALCATLSREIVRHVASPWLGGAMALVVLGAIAAGFPFSGAWYDVIRPDTLSLCLVVLGAALVSEEALSVRRGISAGLVLTLAVFSKQSCVFFVPWLLLYSAVRHRRSGLLVGLAFAASSAVLLLGLQLSSKGQFWLWTMVSPQRLPRHFATFHPEFTRWVLGELEHIQSFLVYISVLVLTGLVLIGTRRMSARGALWIGLFVMSIPAALMARTSPDAYSNLMMPPVVLAPVAAVILLGDVVQWLEGRPVVQRAVSLALLLYAARYLQVHRFNPSEYLPSRKQRSCAEQLNRLVAGIRESILIPSSPFLPIRNGHDTPQFQTMVPDRALNPKDRQSWMISYFRTVHPEWLMTDGHPRLTGVPVTRFYQFERKWSCADLTLTGLKSSPRVLYRWKGDALAATAR